MMVGDNDTKVGELGPSGPSCFVFSWLYDLIGKEKVFCGIFLQPFLPTGRFTCQTNSREINCCLVKSKCHITYTSVAKNILKKCFDKTPVKLIW